jgi:hypothetical protein
MPNKTPYQSTGARHTGCLYAMMCQHSYNVDLLLKLFSAVLTDRVAHTEWAKTLKSLIGTHITYGIASRIQRMSSTLVSLFALTGTCNNRILFNFVVTMGAMRALLCRL